MPRGWKGETLSSEMDEKIVQYEKHMREQHQNIKRIKTPIEKIESIPLNGLDVGICSSLGKQWKSMCVKFSYVLIPRSDSGVNRLRNWDLWGPFFMTIIYGLIINHDEQFLLLFFSIFVGAIIVSFNIKVLGGRISYFQSVAILGYCIFPIFMAMFVIRLLLFFTINNDLIKIFIILAAVVWSILSARAFLAVNVPSSRKFVALYPIILFYIFVGILLMLS